MANLKASESNVVTIRIHGPKTGKQHKALMKRLRRTLKKHSHKLTQRKGRKGGKRRKAGRRRRRG